MRIGRTVAYRQACQYVATNGAAGLRAARCRREYRISRIHTEQMVGGPITWPVVSEDPTSSPSTSPRRADELATRRVSDAENFGARAQREHHL